MRPPRSNAAPPHGGLAAAIEQAAGLLPAQGPISIFIHHNTLHAFEDLPFEDAVERAATRLGCQPFLTEERYRAKLASGRILAGDVETVVAEELGERGGDYIIGALTRAELWKAVVLHGVPAVAGRSMSWLLEETDVLARFRADIPRTARAMLAVDELDGDRDTERTAVNRLWQACLDAVGRMPDTAPASLVAPARHRDLLLAASGVDTDEWIHPPLIRFIAGYLDQGLAYLEMPARDRGLHGCFLELYQTSLSARCGPWATLLPQIVADDRHAGRTAFDSIAHSLRELGVTEAEQLDFLTDTVLALRGWAGMVRQFEERPDRVPARELPATLAGYLAVRLLFERAALQHAARHHRRFDGPLDALRATLRAEMPQSRPLSRLERAWPLFHVAQICGFDASIVEQLKTDELRRLASEVAALGAAGQRRILHLAYERTVRHRIYDALVQHGGRETPRAAAFQAIFCIDEREESFRRRLEEVAPQCETFGTPGFFGVAMYHQSATDAHPRPLCPVAIRPLHYVREAERDAHAIVGRTRRARRRAAGFLGYNVHLGSRMLVRGAVLMTLLGWLAMVPLVLRVVFPWIVSRLARTSLAPLRTRLLIDRGPGPPPAGTYEGFTVAEMTEIVGRVLEDVGIAKRLAALVVVVGHGSVSLNNPHESAHDCGACGGGRGGPNARAFAQMANDARVRHELAERGIRIEASTWFVGAERNTCDNSVAFFDVDLVPADSESDLARAREAFDTARRLEAHERCRRFDNVPAWYPPLAALAHVEGRAGDLAQPRPEYGHATNAFCIIGRRARTSGLFLDRRAFLVSYDPTTDERGEILTRLLAAVVPVVAGISLEYYFSYVDPVGYGSGTKLPHNVTSLLGVMDGAQSDLRTGLPWQMVEIHEPTRLSVIVEADTNRLRQAIRATPSIERLVLNRWIWVASLDPDSNALKELESDDWVAHTATRPLPAVSGGSDAWYSGKRGFLPPASIATSDEWIFAPAGRPR